MSTPILAESGGPGLRTTAASDAYDEMVTGRGALRAHWQSLWGTLSQLGHGGLAARAERARQHLEEDGVSFNLYEAAEAAPRGRDKAAATRGSVRRPWALDPVPLVIAPQEWAQIESGVVQRARLLDRVLADLYGPQRLLAERRYPPALVFGSRDFLRPCRHAVAAAPTAYLQHYSADLARGPDGVWRVVADRAQGPAGAAFALQNRRVLSRVMSEAFRAVRVRPFGGFFETWRSDLSARASGNRDNPRIVLLTPGPYNEAYFEHVYLARQLGATLVEGADLTVRDGRVYLKTLGGLQPVDTVLRRVDGGWCDPLELRGDSGLGVVGLMDAVREGSVAVANAVGSGLIDAPALAAFLPRLAEHVLGEALLLPSIATWWCGQPYALAEVIDQLPNLAIRAALDPGGVTINGDELDATGRGELAARLRARPGDFVAQERIVPSLAPGIGLSGLEPQSIVLRLIVTASGGDYVVMPGGLARIPLGNDPLRAGLQRGGINKDVWVLADEPSATVVPPPPSGYRLEIRRTVGELQSRVADNLFWLGRNIERIDNGARLLRAGLQRAVLGFTGAYDFVEMAAVTRVLARCGVVDAHVAGAPPDGTLPMQALLHAFAPGTLLDQTFQTSERLAASVRDRFSADMWRTHNYLLGELRGRLAKSGGDADRMLDLLDDLLRVSAAIAGMSWENMTRGSGWRFLDLGRRVERAIYVIRVLLGVADTPYGNWDAALHLALELCDSLITYRTRYLAALQPAPALDLVLLDDTNPQSLAFQVAAIRSHLVALPPRSHGPIGLESLAPVDALTPSVRRFESAGAGGAVAPESVDELRHRLRGVEMALLTFTDEVTRAYVSHVEPPHAFGYL